MTETPFFTIPANESDPIPFFCVCLAETMLNDNKKWPSVRLEGESLKGFYRLRDLLYSMKDEKGMFVRADIPLDVYMSYAMMFSISNTFYALKGNILNPPEKKKHLTAEQIAEIESYFYEFKDSASLLLFHLTKAWNYFDYGLQTLEDVFDIKAAMRPIKVDSTKVLTNVTIHKSIFNLFSFMFSWLDSIKVIQHESDFALNFYNCQFIHISDYDAIKEKLYNRKENEKIKLTLHDNIALYFTLSLIGRFFVSDAVHFYNEISDKLDAQKTYKVSTKEVRDHFLKIGDEFLTLIKDSMKRFPEENKIFTEYIERINHWEI